MHPALQNLEVICTISLYVEHRTLPALASTCRKFEHPALNVLWKDLHSGLIPLVNCLPSGLFGRDHGCLVSVLIPYNCRLQTDFIYAGIGETS